MRNRLRHAEAVKERAVCDFTVPSGWLLLDLRMPKLEGVAVTERLRPKFPRSGDRDSFQQRMTPMTTSSARSAQGKGLRLGGQLAPDALANCVRAVNSGRNYVSATIGAKLAAQATRPPLPFANWT